MIKKIILDKIKTKTGLNNAQISETGVKNPQKGRFWGSQTEYRRDSGLFGKTHRSRPYLGVRRGQIGDFRGSGPKNGHLGLKQ